LLKTVTAPHLGCSAELLPVQCATQEKYNSSISAGLKTFWMLLKRLF